MHERGVYFRTVRHQVKESFLHYGKISILLHYTTWMSCNTGNQGCFIFKSLFSVDKMHLPTQKSCGLTFVLLLNVCVAQAHQSHLEAENSYFSVSSTAGKEGKEEEKSSEIKFFKGKKT